MFLPEAAPSAFDRQHEAREARRGILLALRGCASASIVVPAAMQGPRTVYLTLSQRPEFPASLKGGGRKKTALFRRQIEELRQSRLIEEREYRRANRHISAQFVLTPEGMRQCAE
jgi:hypothetical protein